MGGHVTLQTQPLTLSWPQPHSVFRVVYSKHIRDNYMQLNKNMKTQHFCIRPNILFVYGF